MHMSRSSDPHTTMITPPAACESVPATSAVGSLSRLAPSSRVRRGRGRRVGAAAAARLRGTGASHRGHSSARAGSVVPHEGQPLELTARGAPTELGAGRGGSGVAAADPTGASPIIEWQCLHLMAAARTSSAQNGQAFVPPGMNVEDIRQTTDRQLAIVGVWTMRSSYVMSVASCGKRVRRRD